MAGVGSKSRPDRGWPGSPRSLLWLLVFLTVLLLLLLCAAATAEAQAVSDGEIDLLEDQISMESALDGSKRRLRMPRRLLRLRKPDRAKGRRRRRMRRPRRPLNDNIMTETSHAGPKVAVAAPPQPQPQPQPQPPPPPNRRMTLGPVPPQPPPPPPAARKNHRAVLRPLGGGPGANTEKRLGKPPPPRRAVPNKFLSGLGGKPKRKRLRPPPHPRRKPNGPIKPRPSFSRPPPPPPPAKERPLRSSGLPKSQSGQAAQVVDSVDAYGAPRAPTAKTQQQQLQNLDTYGAPKAPPRRPSSAKEEKEEEEGVSIGFVPTAPGNNFGDSIEDVVKPKKDLSFFQNSKDPFRPLFVPSPPGVGGGLARPLDSPSLASLFPEPPPAHPRPPRRTPPPQQRPRPPPPRLQPRRPSVGQRRKQQSPCAEDTEAVAAAAVDRPLAPVIKEYDYAYYDSDDGIEKKDGGSGGGVGLPALVKESTLPHIGEIRKKKCSRTRIIHMCVSFPPPKFLSCPTNTGITRATPTATPLVVISDGVKIWSR